MNLHLLLLIFSITTTALAQWEPWADARRFQEGLNERIREKKISSITWQCMLGFEYEACDGKPKNCKFFAQVLIGLGPIGVVTAARGDGKDVPFIIYQAQFGARKLEIQIYYSVYGIRFNRAQELIC